MIRRPEIRKLLNELLDQGIIEDADYTSVASVVVRVAITYPNGPAIQIRISEDSSTSAGFLFSDEGRTADYLRERVGDSWKFEDFAQYLSILKQPTIECAGNALLFHCPNDLTNLASALTRFAMSGRTLVAIGITSSEMNKKQKAKERAAREERERKAFRFKSRDEAVIFEQRLRDYNSMRMPFRLDHLSLVDAYDFLRDRQGRDRIIAALLDLVIGFCALLVDLTEARQTWQYYFGAGRIEGGSILDSPEAFAGRMEIHRLNTSFVLRYRALWDKIMGILVLLVVPDAYQNFAKSKSKKSKFASLMESRPSLFPGLAGSIVKLTTEFDDSFRTAEAHGSGTIRKWTLIIEPMKESPQMDIWEYRLYMDTTLTLLGDIFRGPEKSLLKKITEMREWVEGKDVPTDLRSMMESLISLLEQLVPMYVASHHSTLVRLYVYIHSFLTGVFYRWHYQRGDRRDEWIEKDIAKLEVVAAEFPLPKPHLLKLIHDLANYPVAEKQNKG